MSAYEKDEDILNLTCDSPAPLLKKLSLSKQYSENLHQNFEDLNKTVYAKK